MTDRPTVDVAIVGYGPAGVVAAALLGQAGHSVYVCDRQQGVYEIPRAISLDHEIMRVFQQLGVADDVARYCEPFTPSEYFGVDGQMIRRMTMVDPPYPQGYTPSLVFTQPEVERVLRARVAQMPNVTVVEGVECTTITQDPEVVTLTIGQDRIHARYAIGCDGGSSTVREQVGIGLDDLDFDEPWLVVDVVCNERGLAKLPKTSVQWCEPERPCTLVIGPGNHRRWEISLNAGEDARTAATEQGTWALLSRWLTPDDGRLWRQSSYRFHALVASRWRERRVFLAGDAAHMQPPFLGQGMCQGIRDVKNLTWKLGEVLDGRTRGDAAERLLDSYGIERGRHVRDLTTRIKSIGAVICERDVAKARARDAQLLADCGGVVKDTPRQDILPALTEGFIDIDTPGAGTLFPQPMLASGRLMDEVHGCGWRLVVDDGLSIDHARKAIDHARSDGLTVIDLGRDRETHGVVRAWMDRHGVHAAIIRPDHYTYATAIDDDGLARAVDSWNQ